MKTNYRKNYKLHYGIEFGREYVVHHIDENRENNEFENLLLLPSKLHLKYHIQKQIINAYPIPTLITGNALNFQTNYIKCLEEFLETLRECNKWHDYKMYLEGRIPNIHGIEL